MGFVHAPRRFLACGVKRAIKCDEIRMVRNDMFLQPWVFDDFLHPCSFSNKTLVIGAMHSPDSIFYCPF